MKRILKSPLFIIISSAVLYLLLDLINFNILAPKLYSKVMNASFFKETVNMIPGSLVYLLVAGSLYFLFSPDYNVRKRGIFAIALFGMYELTNLATIKGWPVDFAIYDWIWGFVVISVLSIYQKHLIKK